MDYTKLDCKLSMFLEASMDKSIYTTEYTLFLALLRGAREEAGVSQTKLAEALGVTQTFISKCERGERRLDVVELHKWCKGLGLELDEFAAELAVAYAQLPAST
ncbi:helix-turn-helix domain-containing protein [Delftia tsuruhatensis]|uniref:helix-turn-helix domain-containing protein n=1 Tax=Delftia tsuruhatensis TaxID=180282 RepID=UPI00244C4C89|nr:helix-turn-helix transcriptional regulator [Delftia tsuruhatensis]MDH0423580.1 helix-turn-helix domain-containing protein [Delftia tsuruhatensis]